MTAIPEKQKQKVGLRVEKSEGLLNQAIQGSESAFQQLVLDEQQNVRVYLSRYIFCSQQVDDVAQEVFLAAYGQLRSFRHESKFSTWILGIARNKARQFLRTELRRQKLRCRVLDAVLLNRCIEDLENEREFSVHQKRLAALRECLAQLPVHSRVLVNKFYFERHSSSSIAQNVCKSNSSVRMKLFRIRKKLAACILSRMSTPDS